MKKCVGHKFGDTLVEVALAIGIFSMVAIAVISVISGSTSSAQSTLETTVTREVIDVQAEALRFLQTAYISGGETGTAANNYAKVWKAITARAERSNSEDVIKYAPTSCDEIYNNNNLITQKAFIVDTHQLSTLDPNKIILTPDKASFTLAATYPRLIYGSRVDNPDETILGQDSGNVFYRAEGVYVVAVKDSKDTYLVAGDNVSKGSAYYDFYIRTCWYNPGAEIPSTISTVVRLYDPDVMPSKAVVKYEPNGGSGKMNNSSVFLGSPTKLTRNKFTRQGYLFDGWCVDTPTCSSRIPNGGTYTPPDGTSNKTVKMYAQWRVNNIMQEFTVDACRTHASSSNFTVVDRRDNRNYTVRYVNGKCWMTSDLKTTGVIPSADSNFSSPSTFDLNSGNGDSHYYPNDQRWNTKPISGYYGNYNFCALIVNTGNGCTYYDRYANGGDLCPTNWQIPNDANELASIATAISLTQNRYWTTENAYISDMGLGGEPEGYYMYIVINDDGDGYQKWALPRGYYMYARCVHK